MAVSCAPVFLVALWVEDTVCVTEYQLRPATYKSGYIIERIWCSYAWPIVDQLWQQTWVGVSLWEKEQGAEMVMFSSVQLSGVWNLCADQVRWLFLSSVYPQYILSILQSHGQCAISNLADYCNTHRATWGCCSLPMFVWCGTQTWARVSMSASRTCKWYALCNIPS